MNIYNSDRFMFLRFDGTISQQQRAVVINKFKAHNGGIILLISLKAGGVGLNLTEAKRVFMMDPWWSFAGKLPLSSLYFFSSSYQETFAN